MQLDISDMPFRPDSSKHGDSWFDREGHIQMYAVMLDALKSHLGDDWYRLSDLPLGPEIKRTISTLVRKCSESCDYSASVDFITKNAVAAIRRSASSRSTKKVTKGDLSKQAHEHMCPNSVVTDLLTSREFQSMGTAEILSLLSLRALVYRPLKSDPGASEDPVLVESEIAKLDAGLKDKIPDTSEIEKRVGKKGALKYYPLLRYQKVGLLDELVAVTDRARNLLAEYRKLIGLG